MFHRNTSPFFPSPPSAFDYDTYSRPTTSPFSSLFTTPSSTHSHLDSYLPPSYDAYDLRRSRAEQLLLAQKQQERREAEQAAYLSRHRQLERQAAIEQAIREEREKRELEEALRYREEMVRRAREEEELKREYLREMEARKRRQAQLAEEQHRKRMIEEARNRQAQIDCQSRSQPQLDIGDFFKLFLGGPQQEVGKEESSESKPIDPRQQTPSPAPTPRRIETPDLLRLLFGAPQSTPAPVPQQSSAKEVTTPQQPLPSIQVQAPSPAPSSKPSPQNDKEADAHSSDDEAATTVQRHYRRHLARRNALSKLSSLSSTFVDRQRTFERPTTFVFQQSPSPSSDTSSFSAPALAYGSANSSFLSYEDFLVNLLSKIDAIESGGDRQVKTERKALVRKVEKELSRLDSMKERAWEQQVKEAQAKSTETEITEDEEMKEPETATENNNEVDLSASSPSPDNVETSTPAPTPVGSDPASSVELAEPAVESSIEPQNDSAADSSDVEVDNLEPLLPEPIETEAQQTSSPQLTKEALSSLAPPPSSEENTSTTPSPNPPASESGSSTTSSTLTISTEDSPMSDLIEEVLRRAEKLGAEVKKLEVAELKNSNMERAESERKKEEEYVVV